MLNKINNSLLNGPLGMDGSIRENVGDIIESNDGTSLANATFTYKYLEAMYSQVSASVTSLSDLPSLPGVSEKGEYAKALECIKGVSGGAMGIADKLSLAIDRARNVTKAIFDFEYGITRDFDEYLENLNKLTATEEFANIFAEGIILGAIDTLGDVTGSAYIEAVAGIFWAAVSNEAQLSSDKNQATNTLYRIGKVFAGAAEISIGGKLMTAAELVTRITSNIGLDIGLTAGTAILGEYFYGDNGYGEAMLNGTVYAIVSNCISLITGSKVAGAVVGNAASSYASLPFTDDNGDASQGWCAAAGCATTAGGLAGGLYAYAAAATTATAVTGGAAAPVALAVLLGAAIGYFTIGSAKEYADIVSSPEYQESLEHYWDNVPPDSWLQGF